MKDDTGKLPRTTQEILGTYSMPARKSTLAPRPVGVSDEMAASNAAGRFNAGSVSSQHEFQDSSNKVGWWHGAARYGKEGSLVTNAWNYISDLTATETAPTIPFKHPVDQNIAYLMEGVENPHIYKDEILMSGSMEVAERKVMSLKQTQRYDRTRSKNGFVGNLTQGVAGFIMDPSNLLFTGLGAAKGASIAAKLIAKGMNPTKAYILAGVGADTAAEGVRSLPQLASDPAFRSQEYLTNLAMTAAGTGVFTVATPIIKMKLAGRSPSALGDILKRTDKRQSLLDKEAQATAKRYADDQMLKEAEIMQDKSVQGYADEVC
jgi:hypothetical protein